MKRSVASGWNFLLSLEDEESGGPATANRPNSTHTHTLSMPEASPVDAEELLHLNDGAKLVICTTGLPGRGKTHIAGKIMRYISWLGYKGRHFEVAQNVREKHKNQSIDVRTFYEEGNKEAQAVRLDASERGMADMCDWLRKGGQVALLDATHGSLAKREKIAAALEEQLGGNTPHPSPTPPPTSSTSTPAAPDTFPQHMSYRLLWIECACDDMEVVERNFAEARHRNKDYDGMDDATSLAAYRKKLDLFASTFVSVADAAKMTEAPPINTGVPRLLSPVHKGFAYIQLRDFGTSVVAHKVHGFLEAKLVSFCINVHTHQRTIYLVRHGQSEYNVTDKLGGDSKLTEAGAEFARRLDIFMENESLRGYHFYEDAHNNNNNNSNGSGSGIAAENKRRRVNAAAAAAAVAAAAATAASSADANGTEDDKRMDPTKDLIVWTSTLQRTIETASGVRCRSRVPWRLLSEIDAGMCEGMTYAEIAKKMPLEYSERQRNKLTWRYPRGESYMDVLHRLEPVIHELERQRRPVVVVAHRAVLRCLYGYLVGIDTKRVCFLPLPLHTVIKLTTSELGWKEHRYALGPDVGDRGAHESDVAAMRANAARKQASQAALRSRQKAVAAASAASAASVKRK